MREFDADGRKRVIYARVSGTSRTGLLFLKDRTVWTLICIKINVICMYMLKSQLILKRESMWKNYKRTGSSKGGARERNIDATHLKSALYIPTALAVGLTIWFLSENLLDPRAVMCLAFIFRSGSARARVRQAVSSNFCKEWHTSHSVWIFSTSNSCKYHNIVSTMSSSVFGHP